ncbi:MAG TPA: hypothetical protein VFU22_32220 [Roseiflexaceae bacterium]|nr:hypothetical protein [Roseiflexaceae bacterium]
MSIGKQITERLRRLADGDRAVLQVGDEQRLIVPGTPVHASLVLLDHDRYSVTLRELSVTTEGAAPSDARVYLSASAAEVARRLSFLEEPLAVWELDGGERVAQLRSSPPQREGEEVSYWEVTLWAGDKPGARAIRYHWAPGMAEREVIAYPATFALIARMADALADALRGDGE